jgi:hypothetical protein
MAGTTGFFGRGFRFAGARFAGAFLAIASPADRQNRNDSQPDIESTEARNNPSSSLGIVCDKGLTLQSGQSGDSGSDRIDEDRLRLPPSFGICGHGYTSTRASAGPNHLDRFDEV